MSIPTTRQYFKAVFFDLDGTLVRGKVGHESFRYSWQLVWAHLGFPDSERKKYYQQYIDKRITYDEWCDITRDLFREKGLLKAHFFQIAKKVRLTKNCKETLKILRARGIRTVIVSGGIDTFLEAVFPDYFNYFDYVFINHFHYDDSGLLTSIKTTPYDFEGKHEAIVDICKRHGFDICQCVFVGEGSNDLYAVKALSRSGGLTIGYPSDRLADHVDYDLWKDRLDSILDVIFKKIPIPQKLQWSD